MSCWFVEEVGRSLPSTLSANMFLTVQRDTGRKHGCAVSTGGVDKEGDGFKMGHGQRQWRYSTDPLTLVRRKELSVA